MAFYLGGRVAVAIPDNPLFGGATNPPERDLAGLNRRLRTLGLPDAALQEIASYLGENIDTVRAWFNASATVPQAPLRTIKKTKTREIVSWGDDDTKAGLLRDLSKRSKTFTLAKIKDYLVNVLGWSDLRVKATKPQIIAEFQKRSFTKAMLASLMDYIAPKEIVTEGEEVEITERPPLRLPDMLDPEVYKGKLLSSFPRGGINRMRADLALALLGEVIQTPQDGVEESSFTLYAKDLTQAEDEYLWSLRIGFGAPDTWSWLSAFISEMWFQATLTPGPELGKGEPEGRNWKIKVEFFQVYEAINWVFSHGWPTRKALPTGKKRTQEQIEQRFKEKGEWEAYKKAKAKRAREKRKRNR